MIGVGAGVTAATIAKSGARVDAYDVNPGLLQLYRRYPEGTLRVAENPAISIRWQDARSGLALSDKTFDVIQTQPLYLKQAGSGLLNSEQFYRLISTAAQAGRYLLSLFQRDSGTSAGRPPDRRQGVCVPSIVFARLLAAPFQRTARSERGQSSRAFSQRWPVLGRGSRFRANQGPRRFLAAVRPG